MWKTSLLSGVALLVLVEGVCRNYEKDYYEDLGCRPDGLDGSGCPTSYDCGSLSQRSADKCHYKGNTYDQGHIEKGSPGTECIAECRCMKAYDSNRMAFTCVSIECPELFMGPPPPGCYRTYEHGKCCHVKMVCEDTAEKKTPKTACEYKGETLQEGQKFYPDEEPCMQCICQAGYNGSFVEPFCRKIQCNLELLSSKRIAEGCVPVYYGEKSCCPIDWRCPEESDAVLPSGAKKDSKTAADSGKTCKFGKLTMQVGEKLNPSSEVGEGTDCTCRVPPHPVCIQKDDSS